MQSLCCNSISVFITKNHFQSKITNSISLTLMGAHAGCLLSQRIISSAKHDHRQTVGSPASDRTVTPYSVCTSAGIEIQLIEQNKGRSIPKSKYPTFVNPNCFPIYVKYRGTFSKGELANGNLCAPPAALQMPK